MKDIKMLNDNELEMVNGGEIESSNVVGYRVWSLVGNLNSGLSVSNHNEEYQDR